MKSKKYSYCLLVIFLHLMLASCSTQACESSYFKSINIKDFPVKPFEPITEDEKSLLESQGAGYIVEEYCGEEKMLTITHVLNTTDKNIYIYFMDSSDEIASYKFINLDGDIIEGKIE